MIKIKQDETVLKGNWIFNGRTVDCDEVAERIEQLINHYLSPIVVNGSGWQQLFQDPCDGRYWELSYPNSELQGGGPPLLKFLSEEEVLQTYKI